MEIERLCHDFRCLRIRSDAIFATTPRSLRAVCSVIVARRFIRRHFRYRHVQQKWTLDPKMMILDEPFLNGSWPVFIYVDQFFP